VNIVPSVNPSSLEVQQDGASVPKKQKRSPKTCSICGHLQYDGDFGTSYHSSTLKKTDPGFCRVPQDRWVPQGERLKKSHKRKSRVVDGVEEGS
jgi:hypothetical protein